MRRRGWLAALLTLLLLGVSGCAPQTLNPLVKNEATDVPGLAMNLHPASADETGAAQVKATLYFRYLDEPMLACEDRTLTVPRDESEEYAIVRALLEGPSAGHSELRRLIPADAQVESVTSRDDILFVTFNEGFLADEVPQDWATIDAWREEAPLMRRLTAQSLAASITENFAYTGVQILIHRPGAVQTSLRLDSAYFLTGTNGLSEPIPRDESLLLSPINTVETILAAWQLHDLERLYRYLSDAGKPPFATANEAFAGAPVLEAFTAVGGTVSEDGRSATLSVSMRTLRGSASSQTLHYPVRLERENGVWKITYERLTSLMAR
ncbi:MAG: GerMN domain-containing protein [Clostridiales bacterium]|nr:GerMN domain-containing protein [Clostridiales bacterium]